MCVLILVNSNLSAQYVLLFKQTSIIDLKNCNVHFFFHNCSIMSLLNVNVMSPLSILPCLGKILVL